tara:strand:- start:1873 stop:2313 length:441 start_codon:yes stop_codon:yes gene_type:complete
MKKIPLGNKMFVELVTGAYSQIFSLYSLLKERKHTISHTEIPDFERHKEFVHKHPYRYWFIFEENEEILGSFYIKNDNSIGMNLNKCSVENVKAIISYIKENIEPSAYEASIIPPYFYLNIPSTNKELQKILHDLDIISIQVSYRI